MPLCGATTDENNRLPLDKRGLQGGGAWKFANLPLTPSLCKEGERHSHRSALMILRITPRDENIA